jgi:hypothetical protein
VYRITFNDSITGKKFYYYGYRDSRLMPINDTLYWSSSKIVKKLVQTFGQKCFVKKIFGVYAYKVCALEQEVYLHKKFDVKNHPQFINLANQTSTKFEFVNCGKSQSEISNRKRSNKLKNSHKSLETREKIRQTHLIRERSLEETLNRQEAITKTNKRKLMCLHCQKIVGIPGGYRWHFENCLKNPNVSEKTIQDREQLRQLAIARNIAKSSPRKMNL